MGVVIIQQNGGGGDAVGPYIDGTLANFVAPENIDTVYDYRFYNMTSLQSVKIGDNVTQIKQYAFNGCRNVAEWELPRYATLIGSFAFALTAKNGVYIDFNFDNTVVEGHAFEGSNLRNLIGYINGVGALAFYSSSYYDSSNNFSFTNLKIDGAVGANAFNGRRTGRGFFISRDSNITSVGEGAFGIMSYNYTISAYHILDFRNSTFTSLPANTFGQSSSTGYGLLNALIYLPTSLLSMSNYVFNTNKTCYYYFSGITPPSLSTYSFSGINQWGGIFVPYNNINTYKTATNWTTVSQYIKGWAPENTFSVGETLPTVNQEGYGLTWYTDRECTTQISVVVDADVELYCVASAGSVVDPVFENNDWSTIRQVVRMGIADQYWSVGDTKQITLANSTVVTYRIADMQAGRYALADGSGYSNMVLEQVDIAYYDAMESSQSNSGGFADSVTRTGLELYYITYFPQDVKDAISEVVVLSGIGGGTTSGVSSSNNKLFLPAECEMFSNITFSVGLSESPLGQFDYYVSHNNNSDRIKSQHSYWLRSPQSGNSVFFCKVNQSGGITFGNPISTDGIAPVFAI